MKKIICSAIKKNINKTGIIILLIFTILGLYVNHTNMNEYENMPKDEFIKAEKKKFDSYFVLHQYVIAGFKTMYMPSPISSMFWASTSTSSSLTASVDAGYKLYLSGDGENDAGNLDFSRYAIIFWSIVALSFGWLAYRKKKYLKQLMNHSSKFTVYFSILFARLIVIFLSLLIFDFSLIAQCSLNGINLSAGFMGYFLVYIMNTILAIIIFLIIGAILGMINNALLSFSMTFLAWFVLVIMFPNSINLDIHEKPKMKTYYKNVANKVEIIAKGEKESLEKIQKGNGRIETVREYIEGLINGGIIEKIETGMLEKINNKAKKIQLRCMFTPVTFYQSVNNELSSMGYNGYIEFYKFNILNKRKFLEHYLANLETEKLEPFLNGDEYIYYAKPSLPAYFGLGLAVQAFWIVLLFAGGYILFSRSIYPKPVNAKAFKDMKIIDIQPGRLAVFHSIDGKEEIYEQAYNALSGKCEKNFIKINGKHPAGDFFYLPDRKHIPEGVIPESDVQALEYAAGKSKTIVLDGFVTAYKCEETNRKIKELKEKGHVFISLDLQQQIKEIDHSIEQFGGDIEIKDT
ncbi:MAG: hypothetical protein KAW12_22660 [Candidatus Aminicenantes bacterium]|nr:hypothetical protein [Candidatus Aminicenantes bacterium]